MKTEQIFKNWIDKKRQLSIDMAKDSTYSYKEMIEFAKYNQAEQLLIQRVSNRRELLIDFFRKVSKVRLDDKGNMHTVTKMVDEYLKDN